MGNKKVMKKIIDSISSLLIIASVASCKKNMEHATKQIVIDTALAAGTGYVLDLKSYGDADDVATITKQATNFSTSEITNTTGVFAPVYHYEAAASKTNVADQVVLSITEGNHGNGSSRHMGDSTNIIINFLIK
jgi:hypothetical protein